MISEQKQPVDFRLYLITDRRLFTNNNSLFTAIEASLKAGVNALQLREKDLGTRDLLQMAYEARELTAKYGARLFINDRVDIAMAVDADGVHLGIGSLPAFAARKASGGRLLIGVSAHSLKEALKAQEEEADFITCGPIFETPSKMKYGRPVGLALLGQVSEQVSIPVFGIGGIKKETAADVVGSGAAGIALISAILAAEDIKSNTEEFMRLLK